MFRNFSTPVVGDKGNPTAKRTAPDGGENVPSDMVCNLLTASVAFIHHLLSAHLGANIFTFHGFQTLD